MKKWLLLTGAILCEVGASLSLKAALDQPVWYVTVVVGYLAAFVVLAGLLRTGMTLGVVYGIWGAGGVALTALLGAAIFGEPLTLVMGGGIVLLISGVVLVELGSQRANTPPAATAIDGRSDDVVPEGRS